MLMKVDNISKSYGKTKVLEHISMDIRKGDTIGIMGKNGCGKTTLAKLLVKLSNCDSGQIIYRNRDITHLYGKALNSIRPELQLVFQDYRQALPSHLKVGYILTEPLVVNRLMEKEEAYLHIRALLSKCDLPEKILYRYPHQLSGGQAQRVVLIRSLSLDPSLLILDEVTSGLDVETANNILNLARSIGSGDERSIILISHDKRWIEEYCNTVYYFEDYKYVLRR